MAAGNTGDSTTHIATWKACRAIAGHPGFLYVADSKLCTRETAPRALRGGGLLLPRGATVEVGGVARALVHRLRLVHVTPSAVELEYPVR